MTPDASRSALLTACALCGLDAVRPVIDSYRGVDHVFCCNGCKMVWTILVESGQWNQNEDPSDLPVYTQALRLGLIRNPPGADRQSPTNTGPASPSEPSLPFQLERSDSGLGDIRQCILRIDGMWCAACGWLIAQALRRQRGVVSAEVSFSSDTARVAYHPAAVGEDRLSQLVASLGYSAHPLGEGDESSAATRRRRADLIRVCFGVTFAMNVMMLNFVLYAGYLGNFGPLPPRFFSWLLLFLSAGDGVRVSSVLAGDCRCPARRGYHGNPRIAGRRCCVRVLDPSGHPGFQQAVLRYRRYAACPGNGWKVR